MSKLSLSEIKLLNGLSLIKSIFNIYQKILNLVNRWTIRPSTQRLNRRFIIRSKSLKDMHNLISIAQGLSNSSKFIENEFEFIQIYHHSHSIFVNIHYLNFQAHDS